MSVGEKERAEEGRERDPCSTVRVFDIGLLTAVIVM